ncbi:MAG: energy transducer TonB [Candidatus Eisenbacteria bacterium]|nr:energy transducer TonB [Candidatus Eisenbacteria bacterium]
MKSAARLRPGVVCVAGLSPALLTKAMPDDGHLGALAVRRLIPRFTMIGLAISIVVHVVAISAYYVADYLANLAEPLPTRVVYLDPSNLGPPPMLSGDEATPGSFGGGEYKSEGKGKPDLPPEGEPDADLEITQNIVPTPALTPDLGRGAGGSGGMGFGGGGGTGRGGGSGKGGTATPGKYSPPTPIVMTWPSYPPAAQRRGIRGTVTVRVHVCADGTVDRAEIVSGLEDQACRAAATEAVMKFRFMPALLDDKPVDAWFACLVEFGKKR